MTDSRPNKRIEFSPAFQKLLARAPTGIKQAVQDAIDLFEENPHNPALRNHPLREEYAGFRSIDVTEDWRALYRTSRSRPYKLLNLLSISNLGYIGLKNNKNRINGFQRGAECALYREEAERFFFSALGTHEELYG